MQSFDAIAERRIREAQDRGDFDNLPGSGAPLALDDDPLVPEDLRVAYRLLRNAGFIPPELAPHREIRDRERRHLLARINFLLTRTSAGRRRGQLQVEAGYFESIAARLSRS
jgi:hypothetical protein